MADLIARLFPYDDKKHRLQVVEKIIEDTQGTPRFLGAKNTPQRHSPGRWSRETTAALEEDENEKKVRNMDDLHCIQLKFNDHTLKNGKGIMFGWNPDKCDIVLPKLNQISREHCYLTFDNKRRLILVDKSTNGTIVKYDSQGGIKKRNFTWILGGDRFVDARHVIVIQIHDFVKLQIVVAKHDTSSYAYMDNVDGFLAQIKELREVPFAQLGLESRQNTKQIGSPVDSNSSSLLRLGTPPPTTKSILLTRSQLGQGSFGRVNHVWDVSTGAEYAAKLFFNPGKVDWKGEVNRMTALAHPNIVQLKTHFEGSSPQMIMEYVPMGDLEHQWMLRKFSTSELEQILTQCLSALEYLHGQDPPFVHRDIKPENILVQSRAPMHIKLSDFGLSKASNSLHTFCGTLLYAAPEIFALSDGGGKGSYTAAVDVWSLGATVLAYGHGLPRYTKTKTVGINWCKKLIQSLLEWDPAGFDVLYTMLVMEPQERASASACLQHVLNDRAQRAAWTAIDGGRVNDPAIYSMGDEATVPYDYTDIPTRQPQVDRTRSVSIRDSEIDGYIRPHRSVRSGVPTIIQAQNHPSTSLPSTTRGRDNVLDPEIKAYIKASQSSRLVPPTTVQKRARSSTSSPLTTTPYEQRPRQRTRKSGAKSAHSNRSVESELVLDLFGDGWLNDPNCVGSYVAALGQSESSLSGEASATTTRVGNFSDPPLPAIDDASKLRSAIGWTPSELQFFEVFQAANAANT